MENTKKYPILGSFAAKTVAVIFLCIFGIGVLFGGTGILYSLNYQTYKEPEKASYYDTEQCANTVKRAAHNIMANYIEGNAEENLWEFDSVKSNIIYSLYDVEDGEKTLLQSNDTKSVMGYKTYYRVTVNKDGYTWDDEDENSHEVHIIYSPGWNYIEEDSVTDPVSDSAAEPNSQDGVPGISANSVTEYAAAPKSEDRNLVLEIGATASLEAYDSLWQEAQIYFYAHNYGKWLVPVLTVSLILFLADLIFLLCSAGHRKGKDGIELNWFDRIPLDILAVVLIGAIVAFAVFIWDVVRPLVPWGYFNGGLAFAISVVGSVACLIVEGLMVLALIMTLATRIKFGSWWKNTWIWMFGRAVLQLFEAIPSVWQVTLGAIVYLVLTAVFLAEGPIFVVVLNVLAAACAVILAFFYKRIARATERMAGGDLETGVDTTHLIGPVKRQAVQLNSIQDGMRTAVESRMKSERMKTELITNVSHDIKTPLTSIINYVDLLQKSTSEEDRQKYMDRLSHNANRLKKLTEDLIEASKASTGNIPVHAAELNLLEITEQAAAEYEEKWNARNLETVMTIEPDTQVYADGRLLWRVLSNLFSNISKYAHENTRIYIDGARMEDGFVELHIKNISENPLNIDAEELMERFVREDSSRHTEGSGLGLNIAKSLMELQNGELNLSVDGDLFRADLKIPAVKPAAVS